MKEPNGVHDLMFCPPYNLLPPSTGQTVPVQGDGLSSSNSSNMTPTIEASWREAEQQNYEEYLQDSLMKTH